MSLNPEPSAPEDRAEQDLAPKSYAAAAEEALEPESHANDTDGTVEQAGKSLRGKLDQVKPNGIKIPTEDDKNSLEGVGMDSSPKSPTRGHKRVASRSSQTSLGRKHGEQTDSDVYEKHQNGHGDALTSVKPPTELEKVARTDAPLKRRNSELKSGRQAGAGWARSKYVQHLKSAWSKADNTESDLHP
jgi:hypothetical protein